MTGLERLEQLLRQFPLCVFARGLPFFHSLSLRRQGRQGSRPGRRGAYDLLDGSRLWNNPVHADGVIIPSK